jgi:hypothetical protein
MKRLSPVDREALERALKIILGRPEREDRGRRAQVERMLEEDGWFRAADFCVYCCQMELVRPRLWQPNSERYHRYRGHLGQGRRWPRGQLPRRAAVEADAGCRAQSLRAGSHPGVGRGQGAGRQRQQLTPRVKPMRITAAISVPCI